MAEFNVPLQILFVSIQIGFRFFVNTMAFGWLVKVARFLFQEISRRKGRYFQETLVYVLELPRGRLYPLFSDINDISLCKGSKCRDDC